MTFEEFKDKALYPKECDGAGIYKVRLINYETQSEYPLIECDVVFESFFPTYEEALKSITAYSYSKTSQPYCGFISYHKYGENSENGYYNKLWLFDPNGKLIDESLSPGTTECHYIPFRGRPQNLVRFKIGEIIEVIDLFSNTSSLAIIARPPLSIEQAWDINLRNNKKTVEGQEDEIIEGRIATLMTEDDYYKVIYLSEEQDNYLDSHVHPTLILRPCKEVPNDMKLLLLKKLKVYNEIKKKDGKPGN